MAVYFFDSSSLVKRYIAETGTLWIREIADPASGNGIYAASLAGVETVSAVVRRLRRGETSPADAAVAVADFRHHYANVYFLVGATSDIIADAMSLVERHGLRAYDAVQLATALQVQVECRLEGMAEPIFVSADDNLNAAATAEGHRGQPERIPDAFQWVAPPVIFSPAIPMRIRASQPSRCPSCCVS